VSDASDLPDCPRPIRTAIRQAEENDMKLMNAKDWKGDSALYTEDAIQLPPNQAAVQGKAAIQAWMAAFPPFSNFQEQSLEIEGQGDLAFDRGTYSMTVTPAGAAPIEDRGKHLIIWRKQETRAYKPARNIFGCFRRWPKTLSEFAFGEARFPTFFK
jgi:ketosteroid isomerase-like protein